MKKNGDPRYSYAPPKPGPSFPPLLLSLLSLLSVVIPTTTLQLAGGAGGLIDGIGGQGGGHMQYISGQEFFVPAGE